jgi:hypothetical protein
MRPVHTESAGTGAIELNIKEEPFIGILDVWICDCDGVFTRLQLQNVVLQVKEALTKTSLFFFSIFDKDHVIGDRNRRLDLSGTAIETRIDVFQA